MTEVLNLAGKPWSEDEDRQLITEYTRDKLKLMELCSIHKRKAGGISSRLVRLNVIDERRAARGYSEYLESAAYKEICDKRALNKQTNCLIEQSENKSVSDSESPKSPKTFYGLDKGNYPSRMGQPWLEDEVIKLLTLIQKKKSLKDIAKQHDRTEGGIIAKLKGLAVDYHFNDERPIEEIMKFTGLNKEEIVDAIRKKEYRDSHKRIKKTIEIEEDNSEPTLKHLMELMKDLQYKVNVILEKIQ